MGIEPILGLVWLVALVASLVLSWRAIERQQWLVAAGTTAGLLLAFLPLMIWPFQATALLAMVMLAGPAAIVLAVSYAIRGRIGRAVAATALVAVPICYSLITKIAASSTHLKGPGIDQSLLVLGELMALTSPLICALACR